MTPCDTHEIITCWVNNFAVNVKQNVAIIKACKMRAEVIG